MIPYGVYKVLHLIGILMIIIPLASLSMHLVMGGTRANPWRMRVALTHGIGMFLSLLGGFGALARLNEGSGNSGLPGWVYGKLAIWLCFGLMIGAVYRLPGFNRISWWVILALFGFAAYLAIYKPF